MAGLRVRKTSVDKFVRGQLKTAKAEAKGDPDSIQEVALPVKKIGSDLKIARLGDFLPEREGEFKASAVHCQPEGQRQKGPFAVASDLMCEEP